MIVQVNYICKWEFKEYPEYKIITCKKIINTKRCMIVKCTKNGGSIGYFISGKFFKKKRY